MIEVSVCPVSSWSSRASRRRSTSCAATTRCTASRATRSERSTATAAREANVSASRRSSSEKRTSRPPDLVVGRDHADRAVADDERHPEARPGREPAVEVVVDRAGRVGVGALAAAAAEHRAATRFPPAGRARRGSPRARAGDGGEPELRRPAGSSTATTRAPSSSRRRAATRSSSGCSSVSVASAFPTSFSDSRRCDQRVASSARSRVSASSFWIVNPTIVATRDPDDDRPPVRDRVSRRADRDQRDHLDESEPDQADHELAPACRRARARGSRGSRGPPNPEALPPSLRRRSAASTRNPSGTTSCVVPRDAAPAERERDQRDAEAGGARELAVVAARRGQRDERERHRDAAAP